MAGAADRRAIQNKCSTKNVEVKAELIETNLTDILKSHATPLKITAHFKGWWRLEAKAKRKKYRRTWHLFQ